jgi:hypothetical protein
MEQAVSHTRFCRPHGQRTLAFEAAVNATAFLTVKVHGYIWAGAVDHGQSASFRRGGTAASSPMAVRRAQAMDSTSAASHTAASRRCADYLQYGYKIHSPKHVFQRVVGGRPSVPMKINALLLHPGDGAMPLASFA